VQLLDEFGADAQRTVSHIADSSGGRAFLDRIANELVQQYSDRFLSSTSVLQYSQQIIEQIRAQQIATCRDAKISVGGATDRGEAMQGVVISGERIRGDSSRPGGVTGGTLPRKRRAVHDDAAHPGSARTETPGFVAARGSMAPPACGVGGGYGRVCADVCADVCSDVCADADAAPSLVYCPVLSAREEARESAGAEQRECDAAAGSCADAELLWLDVCGFGPSSTRESGDEQLGLEGEPTAGPQRREPGRLAVKGSVYFAEGKEEGEAASPAADAASGVAGGAPPPAAPRDAGWLLPPAAWWSEAVDADEGTGDGLLGASLLADAGLWGAVDNPDVLAGLELPESGAWGL
jgi:hypothetical protein